MTKTTLEASDIDISTMGEEPLLTEIAWEVCNQVGGIYTVIRSKISSTKEHWGENYCLIGPYEEVHAQAEFEPIEDYSCPFGKAVLAMRSAGFTVHFGRWLVSGRPLVVLLEPASVAHLLGEIKKDLYEHHYIASPANDSLLHQVLSFGFLVKQYLSFLAQPENSGGSKVVSHFHEWMGSTAILDLRREQIPIKTVFTTHATMLGRYLAMNDPLFYDRMPSVDWQHEAYHFNIETIVKLERAAAHGSQLFTTVSEVTARECQYLLGRHPDAILPNGLNIERFTALHEFQNLHQEYKEEIHQFTMAHFFPFYNFDLDKTLYLFTSGRYEYKNKGFDLTLEALARLNYKMKKENIDKTIVMFFITKQPYHSINPAVLHSHAMMEELRQTCNEIQGQVGDRLFYAAAGSSDHRMPDLNTFVDDYWRLRLRRTLQTWKAKGSPPVVTHHMKDDDDDILNFLRLSNMHNASNDKVKIVYHPDFISTSNPLFGMEYGQFVRGCHMGVFPSYYEPWGYTPLECIASGVPAITSDLSGFGDYVLQSMPDYEQNGLYVIKRRFHDFNHAEDQLSDVLVKYIRRGRRDRITLRNKVERSAEFFDWQRLTAFYEKVYSVLLSGQ